MGYKDFTDQGEEEISVFERDPATDQLILMVRPVPPPFVKESNFNKSVHTKMCVVYRDDWEIGDLVDWWYHTCWWSAKVISVVGDGRFELVCPAPPGGEGGVYLASSRDMRPSLKWSVSAQWTAPPSKEIGRIPCARIVRLLDRYEAKEFVLPNQDQFRKKRGRPKRTRVVSHSILSKLYAKAEPLNSDTKFSQKRGRPRRVEEPEGAAQKRSRPIVIKVIHPRQITRPEQVEHESKIPSDCGKGDLRDLQPVDERTRAVNYCETEIDLARAANEGSRISIQHENDTWSGFKQRSFMDVLPDNESRNTIEEEDDRKIQPENETNIDVQLVDDNRTRMKEASPTLEMQSDEQYRLASQQAKGVAGEHIGEDDSRHVPKQKRAADSGFDNSKYGSQGSHGHLENFKRRKLDHIKICDPKAGHDPQKLEEFTEQRDSNTKAALYNLEDKTQGKLDESVVRTDTMVLSSTGDVAGMYLQDLVPRDQITLPDLNDCRESSAEVGSGQNYNDKNRNGDSQAGVFGSNGAVNILDDWRAERAYKDALDLKVLNAYEEAFADDTCSEHKKTCLAQEVSIFAWYKEPLTQISHSGGKKPPFPCQGTSRVKRYGEVFTKNVDTIGRKTSGDQDTVSESRKLRNLERSCRQENTTKVIEISSSFKGIQPTGAKSSNLLDRYEKKPAKFLQSQVMGTKSVLLDTASVNGSPSSMSGRLFDMSAETIKVVASSHIMETIEDDEENLGSSLDSGSSIDVQSRKAVSAGIVPSGTAGIEGGESEKVLLSSMRRRNPKLLINNKISLSRKLVHQARREVLAKRRSTRSV